MRMVERGRMGFVWIVWGVMGVMLVLQLVAGLSATAAVVKAGNEERAADGGHAAEDPPRFPNILYLVADDMRTQLGCYGHSYMKTPNLDKLASTGLQFDFAFTQFAFCAPSRNSFLSGRRPDRTRALNFLTTFRNAPGGKNWTSMPQFFKKNGYFTSSAGKIYHGGMDDPPSWSYPSNQTAWVKCGPGDMIDEYSNYCGVTNHSAVQYTDEDLVLEEGLKRMELAHESGRPWWVSIGVHRPHVMYRVPKGFYGTELYPGDAVLPPKHRYPPTGVPYMAGNWADGDIKDPAHGCPTCVIPDDRTMEYRRWYYAATTWSDHSLGRALHKLDDLGATNNTIVIFHSDHGYQLGELNEWSKMTDTELAVHVPLLVRVPWKHKSIGKRTKVRAELIDLYRTLADLTALGGVEETVQGTSLASVFDNPEHLAPTLESKVAYSQIPRCECHLYPQYDVKMCKACAHVPKDQFNFMGYSMRTDKYRFTAWVPFDDKKERPDWSSKDIAYELYDVSGDNGRNFDYDGLSDNLATNASFTDLVHSFRKKLQFEVNTWD